MSYATEDVSAAAWLARKLAAAGYAVWFDQMKMLGSEPWPQTIDDAIKRRTFRMVALISQHSLQKPKPTAERTLAQRIGEQRKIPDFMIPVRLDQVEPDWLTAMTVPILFHVSWAEGLRQLLKKLESVAAPKHLAEAAAIAASSFPSGEELVSNGQEKLYANVMRVNQVPDARSAFEFTHDLSGDEREQLRVVWPFYRLDNSRSVAFDAPPSPFTDWVRVTQESLWPAVERLQGVRSRDIVANLIVRAVQIRLLQAKFQMHPKRQAVIFLGEDYTEDGRLKFTDFLGKSTWLKIRGKAKFWRPGQPPEVNYHHYALRLKIGRGLDKNFWLQVTPFLFFFDETGKPIVDKRVGPRRRRVTKGWWNGKWLNRLLAAEQIFARLPLASDAPVSLDPVLTLASDYVLHEDLLRDREEETGADTSEDEVLQIEHEDGEPQTEEANE